MSAVAKVQVWVGFEDAPWREMSPEAVVVDSVAEVLPIVERALALGAHVTIDSIAADDVEESDDPDLDEWPAERHLIRRNKDDIARLAAGVES